MFKLKLEKVIYKGEKAYKILGWEGSIPERELPEKYLKKGEMFFFTYRYYNSGEYLRIYNAHIPGISSCHYSGDLRGDYQEFEVGKVYPEKTIDALIIKLKEAGSRLSEIRKEIKKLREEWNGEVEVII